MPRDAQERLEGGLRRVEEAIRKAEDSHWRRSNPEALSRAKGTVEQIRSVRFKQGGVTLMVTASVGIATPRNGKAPSFARLIRDAHAAVKAAQLKGGDRAVVR